jgi:RNA polymerase sporulation-specific sigma factor
VAKVAYKNEELIRLAQQGDTDAEEELLVTNRRLCFHIAKRYSNTGIDVEDLASIATIGLMKAYKSFDLSKNIKFATYASTIMNNEILMHLRNARKHHAVVTSLDAEINSDGFEGEMSLKDVIAAPEDDIKFEDFKEMEYILKVFNENASDRDKTILYKCIIGKVNQYEVAEEMNVSQSYVSRLEKKVIESLQFIAKNGYYKKVTTYNKKEAVKVSKSMRKYTKHDYVYILRNYPQLTTRQISEIMGLSPEGVNPYKNRFKKGLYDDLEVTHVNQELLEKLQKYIRDLTETPKSDIKIHTSNHLFIDGDKVVEVEPEVSFHVKAPEIKKAPEPVIIPVKKEKIKNEELIILNNKISITSNKEEASSLIYGLFQILENIPKDSKIKLDVQLEVIK